MSSKTFIEQWTKDIGVEFTYVEPPQEEAPNPLCPYAAEFAAFCEKLLAETKPTEIEVNVALLTLQKAFWGWFESAPRQHKHLNPRNGTRCLFSVYRECYIQLHKLALSIVKPALKPPPPPPRPQPSISDRLLGLGEDLGPAFDVED